MSHTLPTCSDHLSGRVEKLAGLGATEEDIAAELQIPVKRLQKRFRRELARGNALGKHRILERLYEQADSGKNTSAIALWVKARCGWRDSGSTPDGPTYINSLLEIQIRPDPNAPPKPLNPAGQPAAAQP